MQVSSPGCRFSIHSDAICTARQTNGRARGPAVYAALDFIAGPMPAAPHTRCEAAGGDILEPELDPKLDVPRSAAPDDGVCSRDVGREVGQTETAWVPQVVPRENQRSGLGVGDVRMVQDIEELPADLHADPLAEAKRLNHGEVPILERGPEEDIASHVAKRSRGWHCQQPVGVSVADPVSVEGRTPRAVRAWNRRTG